MNKLISFLRNNFFSLLLLGITVFLCWQNYTPGTWLSGWDTLHPEFNFPLNLKRVIAGVWREEQGLGAVAAHAHMAELPRILILWLASIVLPTHFLRYFYVFLCLILGPLGVYWFLIKAGEKEGKNLITKPVAFLGGLFYLFNLGALQHFYVPFEMFPTQFAALPWLFGLATLFIGKKGGLPKKFGIFFWFALVTFLATPMAYASQLWYIYFGCFVIYLGGLTFLGKNEWQAKLKKTTILILVTLAINSFWLLPNLYFLATHAKNVPLAKINRLFSEEAFLANKKYGTIPDTVVLKNFLFNWSEYVGNGNFGYLLDEWIQHLRHPGIILIGYGAFLIIILGIVISLLKKEKLGLALLPVFLASFIFLINMNPPFEWFFAIFRERSSLFREGLRFPFTKFSILLCFTYAIYFAHGLNTFLFLLRKRLHSILIPMFYVLCFILLFIYVLPAFSGGFISPSMRIQIPQDYFDMFAWFNQQKDEGRVVHFPLASPYGWIYYDWGYQGAGFVWFGIKQPFLDRDFDRWNPANEQNYREISQAVYSRDLPLLEKLFNKYQIRWIILDKSVIIPGKEAAQDVLFYPEIEKLFNQSTKIKSTKDFGLKLRVYQVDLDYQTTNFTFQQEEASSIGPDFFWSWEDQAYKDYGHYYTYLNQATQSIFYPFRTFLSKTETLPQNLFSEDSEKLAFKFPSLPTGQLSLPSFEKTESFIEAGVYLKNEGDSIKLKLVFDLPQVGDNPIIAPEFAFSLPRPGQSLIFGFGREQIFSVNNLNFSEEIYLGKVYLSTQKENWLYFWQSKTAKNVPVNFDWLTLVPEPCFKPEKSGFFGIAAQRSTQSFTFSGEEITSCLNIPLWAFLDPRTLDPDSLIKADFSFQAAGEGEAEFSFFDAETNRVLTKNNLIRAGNAEKLLLRFRLEPQEKSQTTATFKNLKLTLFDLRQKIKLDTSQLLSGVTFPKEIEPNLLIQLNRSLPLKDKIDLQQPPHQTRSCGGLVPRQFHRRLIEEDNPILEYSSQEGSVCDYFELPNLFHQQGYLLLIESKNLSGLPLRICLSNYVTHRCDLYTELGSWKNFEKEIFVIPPEGPEGSGYDLHFNNYSIGKLPTVNQLKSIEIIPFPYNWLKEIKIINPESKGNFNSVLVFTQAYEKNWLALAFQPPFFFKKLSHHVLVDNWANGWIVNQSPIVNNPSSIKLIFLPQLLEYLGLGASIIFFVFLFKKKS